MIWKHLSYSQERKSTVSFISTYQYFIVTCWQFKEKYLYSHPTNSDSNLKDLQTSGKTSASLLKIKINLLEMAKSTNSKQ